MHIQWILAQLKNGVLDLRLGGITENHLNGFAKRLTSSISFTPLESYFTMISFPQLDDNLNGISLPQPTLQQDQKFSFWD